jgi:hypothetical protein
MSPAKMHEASSLRRTLVRFEFYSTLTIEYYSAIIMFSRMYNLCICFTIILQ